MTDSPDIIYGMLKSIDEYTVALLINLHSQFCLQAVCHNLRVTTSPGHTSMHSRRLMAALLLFIFPHFYHSQRATNLNVVSKYQELIFGLRDCLFRKHVVTKQTIMPDILCSPKRGKQSSPTQSVHSSERKVKLVQFPRKWPNFPQT